MKLPRQKNKDIRRLQRKRKKERRVKVNKCMKKFMPSFFPPFYRFGSSISFFSSSFFFLFPRFGVSSQMFEPFPNVSSYSCCRLVPGPTSSCSLRRGAGTASGWPPPGRSSLSSTTRRSVHG